MVDDHRRKLMKSIERGHTTQRIEDELAALYKALESAKINAA
jgi:hypothetical protein